MGSDGPSARAAKPPASKDREKGAGSAADKAQSLGTLKPSGSSGVITTISTGELKSAFVGVSRSDPSRLVQGRQGMASEHHRAGLPVVLRGLREFFIIIIAGSF